MAHARQTSHPTVTASEGTGPLLERDYRVRFEKRMWSPERVIHLLRDRFDDFAPDGLLEANRRDGQPRRLDVGDEMTLRLTGIVKCHVRVAHVDKISFEYETLEGHPEAGLIRFEAKEVSPHVLELSVNSRFRQNGVVAFAAWWAGMRFFQRKTWEEMLKNVAEHVQPNWSGKVQCTTKWVDPETEEETNAWSWLLVGWRPRLMKQPS